MCTRLTLLQLDFWIPVVTRLPNVVIVGLRFYSDSICLHLYCFRCVCSVLVTIICLFRPVLQCHRNNEDCCVVVSRPKNRRHRRCAQFLAHNNLRENIT